MGVVLGLAFSAASFIISLFIYIYQQGDLLKNSRDTLKNLEHLAASLKKINSQKELKEELDKVQSWVRDGMVKQALIASSYSALPAFWLDASMAYSILSILVPIQQKYFIGPAEKRQDALAAEVADFLSTPENLLLLQPNQREEVKQRWLSQTNNDQSSIKGKILEEYKGCTAVLKPLINSTLVEAMAVNAIILKCNQPVNPFESKFEVFFFGEPARRNPQIPPVLCFPDIYRASIPLIAKLWKPEIEAIFTEHIKAINNSGVQREIEDFLKEFWSE
jgi:hypothetical protein